MGGVLRSCERRQAQNCKNTSSTGSHGAPHTLPRHTSSNNKHTALPILSHPIRSPCSTTIIAAADHHHHPRPRPNVLLRARQQQCHLINRFVQRIQWCFRLQHLSSRRTRLPQQLGRPSLVEY